MSDSDKPVSERWEPDPRHVRDMAEGRLGEFFVECHLEDAFNAGLERAAEIAEQWAGNATEMGETYSTRALIRLAAAIREEIRP